MPRFLHSSLRPLATIFILALALTAAVALPASAGFGEPVLDRPPRDGHPLRQALTDVVGRSMDLPDVDVAVRLHCAPRSTDRVTDDRAPAVACEWKAGDDVGVRSWQLWNLQVRPARDGRNLVVETGADVTSHLDTAVTAPAAYIYAVLGLDGDGEVIARSRLVPVKLRGRDHAPKVEHLRLECAAHRSGDDTAPAVTVGCDWSEVGNDRAVGYVVWKRVDGGTREVLARVGLETTGIRDDAVSFGHRYTYVVTAVDGDGEIVGRSRAEKVAIPALDRPTDRPVDRPTDRPTDRPARPAPVDTRPADAAPFERPVDTRPADAAPVERPVEVVDEVAPAEPPADVSHDVGPALRRGSD